eukprot:TRINITY_DN9166_c0_g1_i10.p1 TRINITY_DN9166_c0_g1~~TRINITY_DN9166_c0_g1_i10.p1  ORF type:complete len:2350 (+),score=372.49 TRINITY_DN9166_c0_g1_i10:168-7217(+)
MRLLLLLISLLGSSQAAVPLLEPGSPVTVTLAPISSSLFHFRSCSGSESLLMSIAALFGSVSVEVWDQPDITQPPTYQASTPLGSAAITVPPLLGIREYTIRIENLEFYSASAVLTVSYKPVPLSIGLSWRSWMTARCPQYVSVTLQDLRLDEMVVRAIPVSNTSTPLSIAVSDRPMNGSFSDGSTSFNALATKVADLRLGTWYAATRFRNPDYLSQAKQCVPAFGLGDPGLARQSCTTDAACGYPNMTCSPVQRCYMGRQYGYGLLPGPTCGSSIDCQTDLASTRFTCNTETAQCEFKDDQDKIATIEGWTGLQCQTNTDCSAAAVKSAIVCAAPWFDIQVDAVSYSLIQGRPTQVLASSNQIQTLVQPNCVLGPTVDLQLASDSPSNSLLLVSDQQYLSTPLQEATQCSGNDCWCVATRQALPDRGDPPGWSAAGPARLVGSRCQTHLDCSQTPTSQFQCTTTIPATCQYKSSEFGEFRDMGISSNPTISPFRCDTAEDCHPLTTVLQCQNVPRCRLGPTYGGGYLPNSVCNSDLDCYSLLEDQFSCDSGTCMFAYNYTSSYDKGSPFAIPNMTVGDATTGCMKHGRQWCLRFRDIGEVWCEGGTQVAKVFNVSALQRQQTHATVTNVTDIGGSVEVHKPEYRFEVPNTCVDEEDDFWLEQPEACRVFAGSGADSPMKMGTCTAGEYGGTLAQESCATDRDCFDIPDDRFVCAMTNPADESPTPLGYCQIKVPETFAVVDGSLVYSVKRDIPYWNRELMQCTHDSNCTSHTVKSSRRCEQRACRVGAQFGSGRLQGTACETSSDCQALQVDNFKCLCDGIASKHCPDPKSGLTGEDGCAVICGGPLFMRCAYAPTGQAGTAYPIPGWDLGVLACKRDADCQSPFVLNSLKCENSISFAPFGATNTTYVHVWQPNGTATTNLTISASLGSNRELMMDRFDEYNQSQFSPVCNTEPYQINRNGLDRIRVRGVNMAGLRRTLAALGPVFETNGVPGSTQPERNAYKEELSCVFRTNGTLRQCFTPNGDPVPGTRCTADDQCRAWSLDTGTGVTTGLHVSQFSCNRVRSAAETRGCSFAVGALPAESLANVGSAWTFLRPRGRFKFYSFAPSEDCTVDSDCYQLVASAGVCRNATAEFLTSAATLLDDGHTVECNAPVPETSGVTTLAYLQLEAFGYDPTTGNYSAFSPLPRIAQAFSDSPVSYFALGEGTRSLYPQSGPTSGGTVVTLSGSDFVAGISPNVNNRDPINRTDWSVPALRLGEIRVKLHWSQGGDSVLPGYLGANDSFSFTAPGHAGGLHTVSVSMNGQQYQNSTGLLFRGNPAISLNSIHPPAGPVAGGTLVTIDGSDFTFQYIPTLTPPHSVRCKFGDSLPIVPVSVSPTRVICQTPATGPTPSPRFCGPAHSSSGLATVSLTMNNQQYVPLPDSPTALASQFLYVEWPCNLTVLRPSRSPQAGGIKVVVTGNFFQRLSEPWQQSTLVNRSRAFVSCRVGGLHESPGRWLSTNQVECLIPGTMRALNVTERLPAIVEVALNGQQYVPANSTLEYFSNNISVAGVSVRSGPVTGGTVVVVYGRGFFDAGQDLRCKFGSVVVPAAFVHSSCSEMDRSQGNCSSVSCTSPAIAALTNPEVIGVRVSFDAGQTFTWNRANFMVYPTIQPATITPAVGLGNGGTSVTISGQGFQETGTIQIRLGTGCNEQDSAICNDTLVVYAAAEFATPTSVVCEIPELASGHPYHSEVTTGALLTVSVEVSLNGHQFTGLSDSGGASGATLLNFTYAANPVVTGVTPGSGPVVGGTSVTIQGDYLFNLSQITKSPPQCRFVHQAVQLLASASFRRSGVKLTTSGGETEVGSYVCEVPAWPDEVDDPPTVALSVSWNQQQWSNSKSFIYFAVPVTLDKVYPWSAYLTGGTGGGTTVTLTGSNFTATGEAKCRFGFTRTGFLSAPNDVTATFVSSEEITCKTPDVSREYNWTLQKEETLTQKSVLLQLSLNGQEFVHGLSFDFYSVASVASMVPTRAPVGSTVPTLGISGQNFRDTGNLACRVVFASNGVQINDATAASFVNETYVTCKAPTMTQANWTEDLLQLQGPGGVKVQVSLNNQDFEPNPAGSVDQFAYYQEPILTSVSPLSGPATGGTMLTLSGAHMDAPNVDPALPACRFNRDSSMVANASQLEGTSTFICLTPRLTYIGTTVVEFAMNGQTFVEFAPDDGVFFYAYGEGAITGVSPDQRTYQEQFQVTIRGVDFLAPLANVEPQCRFEDAQHEYRYTTATILGQQTLECPTPQVSQPGGDGRLSLVSISLNRQNWITNGALRLNFLNTPGCSTCISASDATTSKRPWCVLWGALVGVVLILRTAMS